jgi:hypothetical protein
LKPGQEVAVTALPGDLREDLDLTGDPHQRPAVALTFATILARTASGWVTRNGRAPPHRMTNLTRRRFIADEIGCKHGFVPRELTVLMVFSGASSHGTYALQQPR